MIRRLLYLVLGLLLGANIALANAASVNLVPPKGIVSTPTGFTTSSPTGFSWAGGAASPADKLRLSAFIAGREAQIPAQWTLKTGAASVASIAVRAAPHLLLGIAVTSWLASYGLDYVNSQWDKLTQSGHSTVQQYYAFGNPSKLFSTGQAACSAYALEWPEGYRPFAYTGSNSCEVQGPSRPFAGYALGLNRPFSCFTPDGGPVVDPVNGQCTVQTQRAPATDADWQPIAAAPLPDAVATELAPKGVPLPMNDPVVDTTPQNIPLSDPYIDPVTGKRYQDVAQVRPQTNGKTADVQIIRQEVDPQGQPVIDPATSQPKPPEEKQEDPCKLSPERIGCSEWGQAEDSETGGIDKAISITPQGGWGPDNGTCPQPLTYTTKTGLQLKLKYDPLCQGASMFRPAILGMAWISAIFAFFGISRRTET